MNVHKLCTPGKSRTSASASCGTPAPQKVADAEVSTNKLFMFRARPSQGQFVKCMYQVEEKF